jgi:cell volume regulation protein A
MLVGLPNAHVYFDIAFVAVLTSLMIQGWTIAAAARWLDVAFSRKEATIRRVELDLPGQLAQEIVGYSVAPNSPYLRLRMVPNWAKPTLVVRDERILTAAEAEPVKAGDYVYLLAPPEKAQALDRFFVNMPPPTAPDPNLLGDFFVTGDHTLGELAEIYGLTIAPNELTTTLADYIASRTRRKLKTGTVVPLGPIALVAHKVENGRVSSVGLRLADPEPEAPAETIAERLKQAFRRVLAWLG